MFSSRNYAIGSAHFRIAGGWRSLIYLCCGYIGVGLIIASIIFYANRGSGGIKPRAFVDFLTVAMIVESFILVLFGSLRISSCIRNDMVSNMIESHRLMPIASWRAVTGYLLGTTLHPLALTVLNVGLVYGLAMYIGISVHIVTMNQIVLFAFAFFIWSFTAMGTLMFRQMFAITFFGLIMGTCGSVIQQSTAIFPGTALILSPFIGDTIFMMGRIGHFHWAYPVALTAQAGFISIFFLGACRRYRGTYLTTVNEWQGLVLAALWTALSITAILGWEKLEISPRWGRDATPQGFKHVQMVASLAIGMLLAIVPLWALAAREKVRSVPLWQVIFVCVATVLVVAPLGWATAFFSDHGITAGLVTVGVIVAHVLTVYFTFRVFRRSNTKISFIGVGMVVGILWALPLIGEMARWYLMEPDWDKAKLGVLATISPIGILASQWTTEDPVLPIIGLLAQFAVPLALGMLIIRRDRQTGLKPALS